MTKPTFASNAPMPVKTLNPNTPAMMAQIRKIAAYLSRGKRGRVADIVMAPIVPDPASLPTWGVIPPFGMNGQAEPVQLS